MAVTHHRDPFDAVGGQKPRDLADRRALLDRHHRRRHDLARRALRMAKAGQKIGAERAPLGKKRQPPIPASLPIPLVAAYQITLADHPDRRAAGIDDRHRADPFAEQELGNLAGRGVGACHDHLRRHHIACLHPSCLPHSGSPRLLTSPGRAMIRSSSVGTTHAETPLPGRGMRGRPEALGGRDRP